MLRADEIGLLLLRRREGRDREERNSLRKLCVSAAVSLSSISRALLFHHYRSDPTSGSVGTEGEKFARRDIGHRGFGCRDCSTNVALVRSDDFRNRAGAYEVDDLKSIRRQPRHLRLLIVLSMLSVACLRRSIDCLLSIKLS
jgi:hypothetical protein